MHASSHLRKQVTVFENSIIKLSRIESENADVLAWGKEMCVCVCVCVCVVCMCVCGGGGAGGPTDSYVNVG